MDGNAFAAGHRSDGSWEPDAEQVSDDPSPDEVVRIVRAVEARVAPAQDRTRSNAVGKGVVLAMGVGMVLSTGFLLNEFVQAVIDGLAASL